jgi:hypothetical protein
MLTNMQFHVNHIPANGENWLQMDRSGEHQGGLRFEGVFPVVSTPFHDDGRCDAAALERLIDYVARAGADGAVYPAIASEFATLDLDERRAMVDVALAACRQRGLPMIIGVSAAAPELSAGLATQAAEGGAAGHHADGATIRRRQRRSLSRRSFDRYEGCP